MADLITGYLAELRAEVITSRRRKAAIAHEARDHLLESASALEAAGMPREEAEHEAIVRFGHPVLVARKFSGRAELWWLLSWLLAFGVFAGVTVAAYGAGWWLITLSHWWLDGDPHELRAVLQVVGFGAALASACLLLRSLLLDRGDGRTARAALHKGGGWLLLATAVLLFT